MNEEILGLLGLTPEQIAQYRQQSAMAGLGSLGQALIQAGAPRQGPRQGTLAGIAQALPAYGAGQQASMDEVLQNLLKRKQAEQMVAEQQAKQKQQTALQNIMRGRSPEEQLRVEAFPGSAESVLFPQEEAYTLKPGEERFRGTQRVAGLPAEEPETFTPLSAQEAARLGLPPGAYQRGDKSKKIFQVGSGPAAVVNVGGGRVGTIPQGFELREDPKTGALSMQPIPGGPAEAEQMQAASQAKGRKEQQARAGGTVVQDLQRALNIVQAKPSATGRSASVILGLPEVARAETDVQAAKGFVESALSNVGLDTLQQMRENSPTGGALGQVPIQQQQRLEQVLGSLDLTQRKEVVEDNIKRVINIYMDIIHGSPDQVEQAYQSGEITKAERDIFAFRHRLSFDELGRPIKSQSPKRQQESDQDLINRYLRR